jgi:hypothetical protein
MELEPLSSSNFNVLTNSLEENINDLKQIKFEFLSKIEGVLVQEIITKEKANA